MRERTVRCFSNNNYDLRVLFIGLVPRVVIRGGMFPPRSLKVRIVFGNGFGIEEGQKLRHTKLGLDLEKGRKNICSETALRIYEL